MKLSLWSLPLLFELVGHTFAHTQAVHVGIKAPQELEYPRSHPGVRSGPGSSGNGGHPGTGGHNDRVQHDDHKDDEQGQHEDHKDENGSGEGHEFGGSSNEHHENTGGEPEKGGENPDHKYIHENPLTISSDDVPATSSTSDPVTEASQSSATFTVTDKDTSEAEPTTATSDSSFGAINSRPGDSSAKRSAEVGFSLVVLVVFESLLGCCLL